VEGCCASYPLSQPAPSPLLSLDEACPPSSRLRCLRCVRIIISLVFVPLYVVLLLLPLQILLLLYR
jgi:hypothetical protein